MNEAITIGPARTDDAEAISSVLSDNQEDPGLFQESAAAVACALEDFFVARNETGKILGCAGLHRDSPELAEVYAVAIAPQSQGLGIGRRLVQACEQSAREKGVRHLWLATVKPGYFARFGFQPISRWSLPASVLLRKLRQTLQQPGRRWLPALFGRHTFMQCKLSMQTPEGILRGKPSE